MFEQWSTYALHVAMVVVGFGFLIFVHEFGHFIIAKWKGVRVIKFSLGFGPAIFSFRMGETQYALSIIPFGGFCKLAGEIIREKDGRPEEEANIPPERLMASKTVGQRAQIFAAGAIMNLLVALPLGVLMVLIGGQTPIAKVDPQGGQGSAYSAGIHAGDMVTSVNGQPVHFWFELENAIEQAPINKPFPVTVDRRVTPTGGGRGEEVVSKTYTVVRANESDYLGLQRYAETIIGSVHPASPARKAGLKLGDEIVSVARPGEEAIPVNKWRDFEAVTRSSPGEEITITVRRKTSGKDEYETVEVPVTPEEETDYEIGVEFGNGAQPVVSSVQGDSPASRAGIEAGDHITAINGADIRNWGDITKAVRQAGVTVPITLLRAGQEINITVERKTEKDLIGIASGEAALMIKEVQDNSPARAAGLMAGDIILKIGKSKIEGLSGRDLFSSEAEQTIEIKRGDEVLTCTVAPRKSIYGKVGVAASPATEFRRASLTGAIPEGFRKAAWLFGRTLSVLYGLFRMEISPENLAGPVGIISLSYMTAQTGPQHFVHFLMVITISLGIFNLLPIPVLDGGHIVFLLIEKIKGKAVSERTFAVAQYAGLTFLLALVLYVTRNDVKHFIL